MRNETLEVAKYLSKVYPHCFKFEAKTNESQIFKAKKWKELRETDKQSYLKSAAQICGIVSKSRNCKEVGCLKELK